MKYVVAIRRKQYYEEIECDTVEEAMDRSLQKWFLYMFYRSDEKKTQSRRLPHNMATQ